MKCTLPTRDKNIVRYLDKNLIKVMLINGRVMVFKILSDPVAVSYTHLDVYKRQVLHILLGVTQK